jgi:hypothetical protein
MSKKTKTKPPLTRTSQGLRDILFDEIEGLREGTRDPTEAMAVANLAKQIINVAKVEIDFHRQAAALDAGGAPMQMGSLQLGSPVASAKPSATAA